MARRKHAGIDSILNVSGDALVDQLTEKEVEIKAPSKKNVEPRVGASGQSLRKNQELEKGELPDNTVRSTFITTPEILEKFRALAYWERVDQKDIYNKALESYLSSLGEEYVGKAIKCFNKK